MLLLPSFIFAKCCYKTFLLGQKRSFQELVLSVLGLAGKEFIFFIAADTVLSFRLVKMLVTQPRFSCPKRCAMPWSTMFSKKAGEGVFSKGTVAWGLGGHRSVDGVRLLVHHLVGFFPWLFFPFTY